MAGSGITHGNGNAFFKKERGCTSKLFCVLNFSKIVVCSSMVGFVYGSRVLDAVFYEFSGIIIRGFLTHVLTTDGDLFTCNDFHAWVKNVYIKGTNY